EPDSPWPPAAPAARAHAAPRRLPAPEAARLLRPSIVVREETLWVDRGEGLRHEPCETRALVVELAFEYEGFRVRAGQTGDRMFAARNGALEARLRDRAAETQARLTLESFGAIELELLEDYAKAPGCEADYVIQPEADAQAHCAFIAAALPQLRALGWD